MQTRNYQWVLPQGELWTLRSKQEKKGWGEEVDVKYTDALSTTVLCRPLWQASHAAEETSRLTGNPVEEGMTTYTPPGLYVPKQSSGWDMARSP